MRRRLYPPLLVLLLATIFPDSVPVAAGQTTIVIDSAASVPMRDGVVLRADIWRPKQDARFPVLVYRTPYDRTEATDASRLAMLAVQRGYVVVIQDVRGRYGSDGVFAAYSQEGTDGYDTIEWAAKQPWSNGAVGSFGLSYPGAVQWLAAVEHPPSLKAMVPAMTYATYARLVGRPDIAVFETEPFKSAVDVIGPVIAELSVGSPLPDFDVWVQVYDVAPEGQAWNLTAAGSGLERASYRDGGPDRKLLQASQIVSLRLDRLFTANRFLPGHRLRVVVSTAFTPWFSVNPQTGELELFASGARAGDVVIHHSKENPSRLLLPVVP